MLETLPLTGACVVQVGDPFSPPDAVKARVDAIWADEKRRRGDRLTNGRIHSLLGVRGESLLIQPAEYRYALARRRAPELRAAGLTIRPLGVTGVLLCADGLVLGRRGDRVASDAGLWELAPAGGLSDPDPPGQIFEELSEELGLEPHRISHHHACGLVEDTGSGVVDIVFRLHTAAAAGGIRAAHAARATDEYAELAIVPLPDIGGFLEKNRGRLLPALLPMLGLAGLLP